MLAVHITLLLLLVVGDVLAAVAPGDEHAECEVPDYPSGIRVLLDSWRYQTLLAEDDGSDVWNAVSVNTEGNQISTVNQSVTVSKNSHAAEV